jgi:hypothetical protein
VRSRDAPSRLIANAQAVILNGARDRRQRQLPARARHQRGSGARNYVNANIAADNGDVPVAVGAGTDIEAGTYDVRVQCSSGDPAMSCHRGNLTVAVAPR